MIYIRPVSDLRNKFPEIEEMVLKEEKEVYLTKNGYGSMVVMSLERYSKLMNEIGMESALESRFGEVDVEKILDEADEESNNPNTKYLTHEEVFGELRRKLNE